MPSNAARLVTVGRYGTTFALSRRGRFGDIFFTPAAVPEPLTAVEILRGFDSAASTLPAQGAVSRSGRSERPVPLPLRSSTCEGAAATKAATPSHAPFSRRPAGLSLGLHPNDAGDHDGVGELVNVSAPKRRRRPVLECELELLLEPRPADCRMTAAGSESHGAKRDCGATSRLLGRRSEGRRRTRNPLPRRADPPEGGTPASVGVPPRERRRGSAHATETRSGGS
jgi:hypothetical protein